MKKILSLLLVCAMILPFAACGQKDPAPETTAPPAETVTLYGNGYNAIVVRGTIPPEAEEVLADAMTAFADVHPGSIGGEENAAGIVIGDTDRPITDRAKALLPALDGDEAAYAILFDGDGAALVWNHPYAAVRGIGYLFDTYLSAPTLTVEVGTSFVGRVSLSAYAEELRVKEEERKAEIERRFAARFDVIADPRVRTAVKGFYEEFFDPEKLIRWWAGLYDPDFGGFYYANSARDNDGYYPDMESTYQVLLQLKDFVPDLPAFFGEKITEKIVDFYRTRQDPDDGYFYHPQWSRAVSRANVMRYSRDQDWAIAVLEWLGSEPLYPTAIDRVSGEDGGTVSTEWQPNESSVRAYISNLLNTTSCEHWGNQIETQATTFYATGMLDTVLDILDARINSTYGLWVQNYSSAIDRYINLAGNNETPYGLYTNAYKIAKCYNIAGRPIPYALKMAENAIKAICSRDPGARVTYLFNPWATLGNVRENLVKYGAPGEVSAYDALLHENVVEMIDALGASLGRYRHDDGSYSYLQSGSKSTIYDTPVSLGLDEGDVNGNNLVVLLGTHMSAAVGLSELIPIFNENHAALFRKLLDNAPKINKKSITSDSYASFTFESDAVGASPAGTADNKASGTTFKVASDPTDPSNKVLEIKKDTEGSVTGGNLTIPTKKVPKMDNSSSIRITMRINVTSDTRYGAECDHNSPNIMQIRMMSDAAPFWMPTLRFNDDATGYTLVAGKNTGSNLVETINPSVTFAFDRWYEFDFVLTIKDFGEPNAEFKVEIKVDGEDYGTSYCFYANDYSSLSSGTIQFKEGKTVNIRLAPQMRIHADVLLDDLTFSYK